MNNDSVKTTVIQTNNLMKTIQDKRVKLKKKKKKSLQRKAKINKTWNEIQKANQDLQSSQQS